MRNASLTSQLKFSSRSTRSLQTNIYINVRRVADPDPHDFGKTYSDPYWSAKLDPDPHKKKDSGSLEAQKLSQGKP
jgi:hypothetical protein